MFWPCETRTSTCRNFATISSGLYRFLVITVLLDVKDIPQVGPLQWGRITIAQLITHDIIFADGVDDLTDAVGAIGVVLEKNFENQRVVHCDATLGSSGRAQLSSVARWHLVNVGFDHLECSAHSTSGHSKSSAPSTWPLAARLLVITSSTAQNFEKHSGRCGGYP